MRLPSRWTSSATLFGLPASTLLHLLDRFDRLAVDRQQHVAGLDAGARRRRRRRSPPPGRVRCAASRFSSRVSGRSARPSWPASRLRLAAAACLPSPSMPPSVASISRGSLSRQTFSLTLLARRRHADAGSTARPSARTGSPFTSVITSPDFRPAFAAALSGDDARRPAHRPAASGRTNRPASGSGPAPSRRAGACCALPVATIWSLTFSATSIGIANDEALDSRRCASRSAR